MEQHQNEVRRAAAQAFAESLDQLQKTLQAEGRPPTTAQPQPEKMAPVSNSNSKAAPTRPALADWEAAVADIEQFIEARRSS
ncbi:MULTISPECIES: hypothetical protein [Trichocoleus]|uniref:Uncharacterized protein n=1 Tax=Trichocoleus desertorum GB2-A4 TaxID=2933944 RepID=A0ABV0J4A1_9CYAN|nr:hypothetical protein [Trichocoleus sp. FACHB-46]MBD1861940.1 hypothetical protein [Trichocoleus sp. FACHB-46]